MAECWKKNSRTASDAARMFGINRCVVYPVLRKWAEGDLRDQPRTLRHQPNKIPADIEGKVVVANNKIRLGPE